MTRNNYNIYQIFQNKIIREFHTSKEIITYVKNFLGLDYNSGYFAFVDSPDMIIEFEVKYKYKNSIIDDEDERNIMDMDYELAQIFLDYWAHGNDGVQNFKNEIIKACTLGTAFGGYRWEYIDEEENKLN